MTDYDKREVEYWRYVRQTARKIKETLEEQDRFEAIDGREWCEENNVMETTFADAIDFTMQNVGYGVSPIHPWREGKEVSVEKEGEKSDE